MGTWMQAIRTNVIALKRESGITSIDQYAEKTGVDREKLWDLLELNISKNFDVDDLEKICDFHNVKPGTMIKPGFHQ